MTIIVISELIRATEIRILVFVFDLTYQKTLPNS